MLLMLKSTQCVLVANQVKIVARWYSKRRKSMYSADMRKYGGIPAYARYMLRSPFSGLERCDFDDECEFCSHPKGGSYALISGYYEPEVDYYICGHCVKKKHYKFQLGDDMMYTPYSRFNQWKRKNNLKDGQFICEYCESIAEGECDCTAYQYHKNQNNAA